MHVLKIQWNKKYTTIAIYACAVSLITIFLLFTGLNIKNILDTVSQIIKILNPIIYGFIIAYVLNPIVKMCEKYVFKFLRKKKPREKLKRILSILLTYIFMATVITIFFSFIVPQIVTSYKDLESKMLTYVTSAQQWIEELIEKSEFAMQQYNKLMEFIDIDKITDSLQDIIQQTYNLLQNVSPHILNFITMIMDQLRNALIGIIFSVYFLVSKEKLIAQMKKVLYAIFKRERVQKILGFGQFTDKTFGGYIIGKLLDSTIIGVITFIVLALLKVPYYPIISLIIGITDLIPFFGPFLGAIPSAFIVFIAQPSYTIWFVIVIILIQQLEGNIISPKILGDSTGLSAMWVVIAITIMGGLFGIIGMFIGVPVFAVIYYIIKTIIDKRLEKKNLSSNTEHYIKNEGEDVE